MTEVITTLMIEECGKWINHYEGERGQIEENSFISAVSQMLHSAAMNICKLSTAVPGYALICREVADWLIGTEFAAAATTELIRRKRCSDLIWDERARRILAIADMKLKLKARAKYNAGENDVPNTANSLSRPRNSVGRRAI